MVDKEAIEQAEKTGLFARFTEGGLQQRVPEATRYYDLIIESHFPRLQGEINPARVEFHDREALSRQIKEHAAELGADLVGITEVNQAYVYRGKQVEEEYAISLGMEMDYERMATAPGPASVTEVARVYYELGEVTLRLGQYIRSLGYPAFVHHPMGAGRLLLQPFAIVAGLGELGRNGLGISPEFGPRFRLGCVTTDLPLLIDKPRRLGVADYCENCHVCLRACPTGAIAEQRTVVRAVEKWAIDGTKCSCCATCIKVCVLNKLAKKQRWLKSPDQALV